MKSYSMQKYLLFLHLIFVISACGQTNSNKQNKSSVDTTVSLKSEQKMDTVSFWKIIDNAFLTAQFNNKIKASKILNDLSNFTPQQIINFELILRQILNEANDWKIVGAQTVIESGAGDDSFIYFRCWLISLGRKIFYEVLKNPDYLATIEIPLDKTGNYPKVWFEELLPMADRAYEIATNMEKDISKYPRSIEYKKELDYDHWGSYTRGIEWDENDLPKLYPNLWKRFRK